MYAKYEMGKRGGAVDGMIVALPRRLSCDAVYTLRRDNRKRYHSLKTSSSSAHLLRRHMAGFYSAVDGVMI